MLGLELALCICVWRLKPFVVVFHGCGHTAGEKLDIKEGPTGLFIPGLRIESVCGPEDVATVLQKGKQNRSTFATNMNEHSSRSHLVLTIYVTAKHLAKGE